MSGGELGFDILISLAITGFAAFLLWFLIKAKGAENDISKWRKAEYASLAVFILIMIPVILFGGTMHFFVVNDQKDEIKQYAQDDLNKIDSIFSKYEEFEGNALKTTCDGLKNAKGPGQLCDGDLTRFFEEKEIGTRDAVDSYVNTIQRGRLIGEGYQKYHKSYKDSRDEIANAVSNWSVMQIPFKAKQIDNLAEDASKYLTELSNGADLPKVENPGGRYTITGYQKEDFSVNSADFKFKKRLSESSGFSVTALVVVAIIVLLILFNYIVAYRTDKIEAGKYRR